MTGANLGVLYIQNIEYKVLVTSMENYQSQAKLFKALMHPVRLAILDVLRDGEECVCHMEAILGHRQAYISQQLMVLRDAGLVQDRRDGLNIFYRVTRPEIFSVIDASLQLTGGYRMDRIHQKHSKNKKTACSCPKCHPVKEGSPMEMTSV
jgi:ArsR family transcriptional regulator